MAASYRIFGFQK